MKTLMTQTFGTNKGVNVKDVNLKNMNQAGMII